MNRIASKSLVSSFKKLALKYHPLKNAEHMRMYLPMFHDICESYEVLSSCKCLEIVTNSLFRTTEDYL